MKIETKNTAHYSIHYQTLDDLLNDAPKTSACAAQWKYTMSMDWDDGYGEGVSTPGQFIGLVQSGWGSLTAEVRRMADQLTFKPDTLTPVLTQAMRRRRVRSDAGSDLDIHAVYQGRIDRAWSNTRHELQNVRRRAAHVYIAVGGLSEDKARASLWRAAAAYRICDLLQRSGFTVEITVGASADRVYGQYPGLTHSSFTAKPGTMPLDLARLAIQSTLGWHRVFNFKARCCNDLGLMPESSMGYTNYKVVPPWILERRDAGDMLVHIESGVNSHWSAKACVENAQKMLEAF